MEFYAKSDKGIIRKINQDSFGSYLSDSGIGFFIVADGMGGHNAGEIASSIAVDIFISNAKEYESISENRDESIKIFIENTFKKINDAILYKANSSTELYGMGSTVVAAVVLEKHLIVGNLGDSRAYIVNKDVMKQITCDHTYVNLLVNSGKINENEAKNHPRRNEITKAVGIKNYSKPDIFVCEFAPGDKLILCSDGLDKMADGEQIRSVAINTDNPEKICQTLIEVANSGGGFDNITVIAVVL